MLHGKRRILIKVSIVVIVIFYIHNYFDMKNQKVAKQLIKEEQHVDEITETLSGSQLSLNSTTKSAPDVKAEVKTSAEPTTTRMLNTTTGTTTTQKSQEPSFNHSIVPTDLLNKLSKNATSDKNRSEKNVLNNETLTALKSLLNCNNKELKPRTYQKGEFWVLENYVSNATEVKCYESITYTTHAGLEFPESLLALVPRWMAPISLAIFAPGDDFDTALKSIQYLRQCSSQSDLVNKYVSFHLFFTNLSTPNITNSSKILRTKIDCLEPAPYLKVNSTLISSKDLRFPINVARNIARDASTTHYLLASDIELYPSPNLVPQFLNMVALNHPPLNNFTNPRVFPISLFEVSVNTVVPTSKAQLKRMVQTWKAIPLYMSLCPDCLIRPQAEDWIIYGETPTMEIFHVSKSEDMWEPIYIGTNDDPHYVEGWEAIMKNNMSGVSSSLRAADNVSTTAAPAPANKDRLVPKNPLTLQELTDQTHHQHYILCVLNYDFMILTNAFLVRKPGIDEHKSQNRREFIRNKSTLIREKLLPKLSIIFGTRPGCTI